MFREVSRKPPTETELVILTLLKTKRISIVAARAKSDCAVNKVHVLLYAVCAWKREEIYKERDFPVQLNVVHRISLVDKWRYHVKK